MYMGMNLNPVQKFWPVKFISMPQFPRRVSAKVSFSPALDTCSMATSKKVVALLTVSILIIHLWKVFLPHYFSHIAAVNVKTLDSARAHTQNVAGNMGNVPCVQIFKCQLFQRS